MGKEKFYSMRNSGNIKQAIQVSKKNGLQYSSEVKNKVEEHKTESDMIAHT